VLAVRSGGSGGQATVEAALALPVVLIALLVVVQVGIVVRDVLALDLAAREGARAGAVAATDAAVRDAVLTSAGPLDASAISIDVAPPLEDRRRGVPLSVSLRYPERLRVPLVDRMASTVLELRASATMRLERPPGASPAPP
jgi:hypothetical protein